METSYLQRRICHQPETPGDTQQRKPSMRTTSRFTKVAVSAGLIVATGAGVLGLTSFASAQVSSSSPAVIEVTTTDDTPTTREQTPGAVEAQASTGETKVSPLAVAADALGMTEAELRTELEAGKSIAQVAEAKNVDIEKVIDALVAERKEHIAAHVAEGKLTQEQADKLLADVETRVTEMVNKTGLPMKGGKGGPGGGDHRGKGGHIRAASEDLAGVLNLSVEELRTQLQSGKSLAAIAEAQNVEISTVKDVLTSEFKAHLDEEVAAGKHTQAEADAKLEQFTSRLDDMVNRVRPEGGMRDGGRHGHSGHGPRGEI